jgi:glycosyltransferase involved in cell wall biosynthesis
MAGDRPTVALLHQQTDYAETLARTARRLDAPYDVELYCDRPVTDRLALLGRREVDLVQVDEGVVNGVLAAGADVLRGLPYVFCVRGWADYTNAHGQYGRLKQASIRARTGLSFARAASTVFISDATRRELSAHYRVGASRVVGRPIDVEGYGNGTWAEEEAFVVLTLTNLRYREKLEGVLTTLRGLEPLFDEFDDLRYRVAGGGRHLGDLRSFLSTYPHRDRVEVLGYREDVADVLAGGDLFVYVSYLDSYATVVLEAQSAGLPVVGADSGGISETVGDAGLVCEPTGEGVREALRRAIEDDDLRAELSDRSRRKMATHNEECTRGHVATWDAALSSH